MSVDQALKNLDIALANIDGETRSAKRSVKSIERVKASQVMDLTRSADIPQLEDLLYVVSFGEGQGSAVLGADKRVEPIFAILDNTSIHADCFTDKITQNSTPNISTAVSSKKELEGFICNLITESALHQIHDSINIYSPNFDKIKVPTYRKEIIANYKVGPLLDTKWDQDNPYNISCPIINGDTCKAGCVAIAIGQILKNGFPNIETLFSSSEGTAVHCNFGWGGNYDGYYTSKYFDICNPRDETMIESNLGDNISSNSNHTFNFNIKTITF